MLATINTTDFLYTCPAHLEDRGFATSVGDTSDESDAAQKPKLSAEEIEKIKSEWEEKQKQKKQKEEEKRKKEEEEKKEDGKSEKKDKPTKSPTPPVVPTPSPTPAKPSHERYTLHRDIFALRQAEHRRRRQTAQAKDLAPRLPGAPRGSLPGGV